MPRDWQGPFIRIKSAINLPGCGLLVASLVAVHSLEEIPIKSKLTLTF